MWRSISSANSNGPGPGVSFNVLWAGSGKILVVLLFQNRSMSDRIKQQLWPALSGITGTVLILLGCFNMHAQVFYSANPNYLKVKTEQNNLISSYRYTYPDTNITRLNDFFPRNFSIN